MHSACIPRPPESPESFVYLPVWQESFATHDTSFLVGGFQAAGASNIPRGATLQTPGSVWALACRLVSSSTRHASFSQTQWASMTCFLPIPTGFLVRVGNSTLAGTRRLLLMQRPSPAEKPLSLEGFEFFSGWLAGDPALCALPAALCHDNRRVPVGRAASGWAFAVLPGPLGPWAPCATSALSKTPW